MTYQADCTFPDELLEQIRRAGPGNDTGTHSNRHQHRHVTRQNHLGVGTYERSPAAESRPMDSSPIRDASI
jgi:hypothetical protein